MSEGDLKARHPAVAGLLSFLVPGLGQLYNGQALIGLACFGSVACGAVLCGLRFVGALDAPDPRSALGKVLFWGGLATFLWLGGVVHAVFVAHDRSEYFLTRFNHPLVYGGVIGLLYGVFPPLLGPSLFNWMLARNGLVTEQQVADWHARMAVLRAGGRPIRPVDSTRAARPGPDSAPGTIPIELPDPEVAARGAATVIHLVLVGGRDGGVFDMHDAQPSCRYRSGSDPSWTNLYANPADSLGVTAIQFRVATDTGTTTNFQLNVNVGNMPKGRAYFVDGRVSQEGATRPSASVIRRGTGTVIRIVGETPERIRLEATIQCRSVLPG